MASHLRTSRVSVLAALATTLLVLPFGCDQGKPSGTASTSSTATPAATTEVAASDTAATSAIDTSSLMTAEDAAKAKMESVRDLRTDSTQPLEGKAPSASQLTSASAGERPKPPAPETPVDRKPGPAVRFEPAVLSMGEMMSDVPKTMSIRLFNVTDEAVTVTRAVPSCGCTTAGAPKDPIAPGSFADVEITLKPGIATGVKLSKKVTFEIEGYAPQVLNVEGNVAEYVAITPKILNAPATPEDPSAAESGAVTLAATDGIAFAVTGVNPPVVDGLPTTAGTEHQLVVDWAKWEEAKRPVRITFTTDHPKAPTVGVSVKRSARDPRTPTPPTPERTASAPTGSAALGAAARSGDVTRIKMEIASGTDVNRVDPATSRTALHWAAQEGQVEAIKALLDANADLAAIDRVGMAALAIAAKGGHAEATAVLLERGADPNLRDAAGGSPLLWAAGLGNSGTVELLIAKGGEVNIADVNGLTPLLWATSIGRDPRSVALLLDAGANPDQADRLSGDSPLIRAAKNANPEVLQLLLARNIDLTKANLRGMTALMTAASAGSPDQVRMLLDAGADSAAKDARGWTALDHALNRSDANRETVVAMLQPAAPANP